MFGGSEIETTPIAKKERKREARSENWFEGSIDRIECAERTKWR